MRSEDCIVLSLDGLSFVQCIPILQAAQGKIWGVKIHDMLDREGPHCVRWLKTWGVTRVIVDAKLHDIPTTVRNRAMIYQQEGVDFVTVHAMSGPDSVRAAAETGIGVLAVTLLTSTTDEDVRREFGRTPELETEMLVREGLTAGARGVQCRPSEVQSVTDLLSSNPEWESKIVLVPGIRSHGKPHHDQKNVMTPRAAIEAGATHLVIGRQITEDQDPRGELLRIESEL